MFKKYNLFYSDLEIFSIFTNLNSTDKDSISYSEYLTATIEITDFLTPSLLKALFYYFDNDQDGVITVTDIKEAFNKSGSLINFQDINLLMQEYFPPEKKKGISV